jgi:hypothetical protein
VEVVGPIDFIDLILETLWAWHLESSRYYSPGSDGSKSEKNLRPSDAALEGSGGVLTAFGKRNEKRAAERYHGGSVKMPMVMA